MIITKNLITTKIEDYLVKDNEYSNSVRKEKTEREGPRLYPSSIGKCTRWVVYDMLGYYRDPMPTKVLKICANGNSVHEKIQDWFDKVGILVQNEMSIKFPEYRISGRVDSIINMKPLIDIDDFAIVEIKSANAKKFEHMVKENYPNQEYLDQLMLYMELLHFNYGFVLVENKNDQSMLEFLVEYDPDHAAKIMQKVMLINECVENKTIPPRDFLANSYECKYCDYHKECFKECK